MAVGPSTFWYSTYLGSALGASFNSIAVDGSGNAYVCGTTGSASFHAQFPGHIKQSSRATRVANVGFVTAINATGTGIINSNFISGSAALIAGSTS